MEMQQIGGGVCAPKGFKAAGVHSGIRANKNVPDLAMILSDTECSAAAVYTTNKVKGAPIAVTQHNLSDGRAWGILCNSGNANTCNPDGEEIANKTCALAAQATGRRREDFIIASTGVIGQKLEMEPFERGVPMLVEQLSAEGGDAAARAIMTTDTIKKEMAYTFEAGGKTCRIGAIGKGSGMINPNMATMLVFITTDIAISPGMLQAALDAEILDSLNQICVDGDTSTNDMCTVLANGTAGNAEITGPGAGYDAFCTALHALCVWMSRTLAADGEGATKLLECRVTGAPDVDVARAVSKTIIASDLFKSAMFGADANWGRALCAIGYTPGDFAVDKISLTLQSAAGSVLTCKDSAHFPYSEEEASKILSEKEIQILIDMGTGDAAATAWGCDLTYEYVKINGDYRS